MKHLILAINPGSTSTKIAVFDQMQQVFLKNIKHTTEQLSGHPTSECDYVHR